MTAANQETSLRRSIQLSQGEETAHQQASSSTDAHDQIQQLLDDHNRGQMWCDKPFVDNPPTGHYFATFSGVVVSDDAAQFFFVIEDEDYAEAVVSCCPRTERALLNIIGQISNRRLAEDDSLDIKQFIGNRYLVFVSTIENKSTVKSIRDVTF